MAQRLRATDLADLAVMLSDGPVTDAGIRRLAETKFALVAAGHANRVGRIEEHLEELGGTCQAGASDLMVERDIDRSGVAPWLRVLRFGESPRRRLQLL